MRFFKGLGFTLLHRRSKSDTAITQDTPIFSVTALPGRAGDPPIGSNSTSVPPSRSFTSLNQRLFEVDLQNKHLIRVNASLALKLSLVESRLQLTISELYAEMYKSVHLRRQIKRDKLTISDLQSASQQYIQFLNAFPDVDVAFKSFGLLASNSSGKDIISTQTATRTCSMGSPAVRQSGGHQYSTALQIILKTRQELRSCKKIALFWKRKAKSIIEHADLVTPSPSEISEVKDNLPKERVEAVTALQRRRQLMLAGRGQDTVTSSSSFGLAPNTYIPLTRTQVEEQEEEMRCGLPE